MTDHKVNCVCCGHPTTCVLHGNDSLDVVLEYDPDKNCVCCNHPECNKHDVEIISDKVKPCIVCGDILGKCDCFDNWPVEG